MASLQAVVKRMVEARAKTRAVIDEHASEETKELLAGQLAGLGWRDPHEMIAPDTYITAALAEVVEEQGRRIEELEQQAEAEAKAAPNAKRAAKK